MKYWVVYHTWKNPSSLLARLTSSMICDLWLGWCRDDISITGITVEGWIVMALEFGRWNWGRMYCLGTQAAPIWESSKTAVKESEDCSLFPSISIINVFLGLLLLLGHIRVSTSSPIYTTHSSLKNVVYSGEASVHAYILRECNQSGGQYTLNKISFLNKVIHFGGRYI